jgi:hypothetical protein
VSEVDAGLHALEPRDRLAELHRPAKGDVVGVPGVGTAPLVPRVAVRADVVLVRAASGRSRYVVRIVSAASYPRTLRMRVCPTSGILRPSNSNRWRSCHETAPPPRADSAPRRENAAARRRSSSSVALTTAGVSPESNHLAESASASVGAAVEAYAQASVWTLERDDRDPAVRPLRIVGEPRHPLGLAPIECLALAGVLDLDRPDRDRFGADLDFDVGMRFEVVASVRVRRRAGLGREDHETVAVREVGDRVLPAGRQVSRQRVHD